MDTYALPSRSLPLDDSWDVIVVGGGPTGSTTAAAAARDGAKTLLIEATSALGGSGTSALVPAWCPFSDKEKIIYRGMAERVLTECKAGMPHVDPKALDWVPIDPERLKRIYDRLVTESGASLLFNTFLSGVERDADTGEIAALLVSNKRGLSALKAGVYVDCSGDADLAVWAGAESYLGDESHDLMPATHCFILTNVDEYAFRHGPPMYGGAPGSPIQAIVASGKYPLIPDAHLCCNFIGPKTVGFNAGHLWGIDNTDPWSVARGLTLGRKMAESYRDALAEFHPKAFGNAFLVATGSVLGIRETRRVVGDYLLTIEDYVARRSFDDEICRNSYFIDVHLAAVEARKDPGNPYHEERTLRYGVGESHGVPYRCLTPKGLRNVLVAGRSISCERAVQGSVRVMPVCLAMGEAAGVAAAQAVRETGGDVHAIDTARLRTRLREAGAYLP